MIVPSSELGFLPVGVFVTDALNQGLRDLNTARQNITERYLLKCDEIFAICPIGRARSDEGVKKVFDLARQARLSNVSIICTKSDVSQSYDCTLLPCNSKKGVLYIN